MPRPKPPSGIRKTPLTSAKAGPKTGQSNLATALRKFKKHPSDLTDESIQQMIMDLILDTKDDIEGNAHRSKVKLDALKLVYEINKAKNVAKADDDEDDWEPEES